MSRREELVQALVALEARLAAACAAAGRSRDEVTLVAVSKTHPASDVEVLLEQGVRDFGESRDQEARPKAEALAPLAVRWHFVGALQTNKAASVATYASVVHSVDRPALVEALAKGAVRADRELDVLLQVSLDGDPARAGVPIAGLAGLADSVAAAEGLLLRGVMTVAPQGAEPAAAFATLAELAAALRSDHPGARTISAGMTGDLEPAIASGATLVRVGTALFGRRPPLLR